MQDEFAARGIQLASSEVILGAVDFRKYLGRPKPAFQSQTLSLLYVGRLTPEKGIETALEALSLVVQEHHLSQVKLTVVGAGEAQYEAQLKKMVQDKGIQPFVEFLGQLPGAELPAIFHQNDIFLFTSIWQEPFGRVLVEAMASECLVLGTATGGASEILLDGETGMVYPPGDARVLAQKISQVSQEPARYRSLIEGGHDYAAANFGVERMAKQIEGCLARIAAVEVAA
jgi:glycosyltransferase involved in cell wall biosynthesis